MSLFLKCRKLLIPALIGIPLAGRAPGQERLTNAGFEDGTLSGAGTISFAGGTNNAVGLETRTPAAWSYEAAGNGDIDLWVESPQAHGGSRYVFLSSNGATESGNDDCLRNIELAAFRTLTGLDGGNPAANTLRISLWAANGQASTSQLNIEILQFDAGDSIITPSLANQEPGVIQDGSLLYRPYTIDPNANGWTPSTTAVVGGIPWQRYWIDILLDPATRSANVWYSAADPAVIPGTQTGSIVMDDASLTVIPEPSQLGLLLLGLGPLLTRRRAAAG
jgi:hypothetical protein